MEPTSESVTHLQSIQYSRGNLKVLDQLSVPQKLVYCELSSVADGVNAIKSMQVRGAPLIAIVGCLSLGVHLSKLESSCFQNGTQLLEFLKKSVQELIDARPTAVNMKREGNRLIEFSEELSKKENNVDNVKLRIIEWVEDLVKEDLDTNIRLGDNGANAILKECSASNSDKLNILTHCNTGSLATAGYGTALGVIRSLHKNGNLDHAFFTETRPYNQGARLTSFELLHDKIPSTMICDSAVSWLMKSNKIAAVVVGADRVARNGDTANKIGTYQLALTARYHGSKFYVAAPVSTIDFFIESGENIVIEERSAAEMTHIGGHEITPPGIKVWNPAFDVTPAELITGIITEKGVFTPSELYSKLG